MSEQEKPVEDPIKQLKGEFGRKHDSLAEQLKQISQQQASIAEMLRPKPAEKPADDLSTIMYSDPARYAQIIEERAEARILEKINASSAAQQRTQSVIGELGAEYPELADINSPLTKAAVAALNNLPEHERNTTAAYRLAVKQAAEDLSVKPKSKRPAADEEFGGGEYIPRPARRSANKLSAATEAFAAEVGLDLEAPGVKERLIARSNRSWSEPSSPVKTRSKK